MFTTFLALIVLTTAKYLKFIDVSISSGVCTGTIKVYDDSDNQISISQLKIWIYIVPEAVLASDNELLTDNGQVTFSVSIAYAGNLQLIASTKNYESAYSDILTSSVSSGYEMTLNPSKKTVSANENFQIEIGLTQSSAKVICNFNLNEIFGAEISGTVSANNVENNINLDVSLSNLGVNQIIAQCYSSDLLKYFTKTVIIIVNESDQYNIKIYCNQESYYISTYFYIFADIYDSNNGLVSLSSFTMSLEAIGPPGLYGLTKNTFTGFHGSFVFLSVMNLGIYRFYVSIFDTHFAVTSLIYYTSTDTEKYVKLSLPDINIGTAFTASATIYKGLSISTDSSFSICIFLYPSTATLSGSTSGTTTNGVYDFNDLVITSTGVFTIMAVCSTCRSELSKTFTVMVNYLEINLSSENTYIINSPLAITLKVYTDSALTQLETSSLVVSLTISSSIETLYESNAYINNGKATFSNIIISVLGTHTAKAKLVSASDKTKTIEIIGYFIVIDFQNTIPKTVQSELSVTGTLYKDQALTEKCTDTGLTINFSLDPTGSFSGTSCKTSDSGVVVFSGMIILSGGTFKVKLYGTEIVTTFSQEFTVNDLYLKIVFTDEIPKYTNQNFNVKVELYLDRNLIEAYTDGSYNIEFIITEVSKNEIFIESSVNTANGLVALGPLLINKLGKYQFLAKGDGLTSYQYESNLQINCPPDEYEFSNQCIVCPDQSAFNYTTEQCECESEGYMINNTCYFCEVQGSSYSTTTESCECPERDYIKDNTCTSCEIINSNYNSVSEICECANNEYVLNNTCTPCEIVGSLYNNVSDQCECAFNEYIENNSCIECEVSGSFYNKTSDKCECANNEYVLNNTCTPCEIVGSLYNKVSDQCECAFNEYIENNSCIECEVNGSFYNKTSDKCECAVDEYILSNTCTKCPVKGSLFNQVSQTCECPQDFQAIENLCQNCDRWLQSSEISATLTDYLKTLLLSFSVSVMPVNCTLLFSDPILLKLGLGYICTFSSNYTSLSIKLGYSSNLKNEQIGLISGVLKGQLKKCGYNLTDLSVNITFSEPLPKPQAIILSPNSIFYECQNMTIDGSLSNAGYGKTLYYKWKISIKGSLSKDIIQDYSDTSYITILGSSLSEGVASVELTVKNELNKESSVNKLINISKATYLLVQFDDNKNYTCKQTTTCQFFIKSIDSCGSSSIYSFSWSLLSDSNLITSEKLNSFWSSQIFPSALTIPSKTFPTSTLIFQVIVTDQKTQITGNQNLTVEIIPDNPVLIIHPLSGSVSTLSNSIINASYSYNPNEDGFLSYLWYCSYQNSECSFNYEKNHKYFLLEKYNAEAKIVDYINITLFINKSSKRVLQDVVLGSSSMQFVPSFVDWEVPEIVITEYYTGTQKLLVEKSKPLVLRAVLEGNSAISNQNWVFLDTVGYFLTPTNQNVVSIDTSKLIASLEYQIKFSVTNDANKECSYFYKFTINTPPTSGSFEVVPSSGIELETEFKFYARDWEDYEGNYPLMYSFSYVVENVRTDLSSTSLSNYGKAVLPYLGRDVVMEVKVCDSLDDCSYATSMITLNLNENFNANSYLKNQESILNTTLADNLPLLLLSLSSSTLNRDYYISNSYSEPSESNLQLMQQSYTLGLSYLNELINFTTSSSSSIDQNIEILNSYTYNPYIKSDDNFNSSSKTIDFILNTTQTIGLNTNQTERVLNVISNSIEIDKETVYNKSKTLGVLAQTLENIGSGLLKNTVENQNSTVKNGQTVLDVKVVNSAKIGGSEIKSSSESGALAKLPEGFNDAIGGDVGNVGMSFTFIDSVPSNVNSTPTIVAFTVFSTENNKPLKVNLKTQDIQIKIPIYNATTITKPACFYLDETTSKWSNKGCKVIDFKSNYILCSCNHLSFFSAGEGDINSGFTPNSNIGDTVDFNSLKSINPSSAAGFYFVGVVIFFYIIISIIAYRKDKKDIESYLDTIKSKQSSDVTSRTEVNNTIMDNYITVITPDSINTTKDSNNSPGLKRQITLSQNAVEHDLALDEIQQAIRTNESENPVVGFKIVLQKHKLLSVFFLYTPEQSRLIRGTRIFVVFLGQMFFIGLFYNGDKTESSSFSDKILSYSFRDFMVMLYSNIIMLVVDMIIGYLLKDKELKSGLNLDDALKVIKRNKIVKIFGLIFCWIVMIVYCWSIGMFALKLTQGTSHMWLFNTGISFIVDLCFTSIIKLLFYAYVVAKILKYYQDWKESKELERRASFDSEDLAK
ncbi:hypothetical protein SteCoe_1645 [Stentor coeruleus]|uniref:PKD/REJ-like domain-containing protein n=1 Tax=Stentor coeruleus TaxID=5963 RepID=A0A1R2D1G4_9CILI|nr:hypothetical protein SteCoe_1645 [Stentor coeruleus]